MSADAQDEAARQERYAAGWRRQCRVERARAERAERALVKATSEPQTISYQTMKSLWNESKAEAARLREALTSIANNSCCGSCQEAKLVARAALAPAADAPTTEDA